MKDKTYTVTEPMISHTVDVSIPWSLAMRVYIDLITYGTTESRAHAVEELMNLAAYIDGFNSVDYPANHKPANEMNYAIRKPANEVAS